MRSRLRLAALSCHAALVATTAATVLQAGATPATLTIGLVVVTPLLATTYGLVRGRRSTELWLALLLVPYAGASAVEVVATSGRAITASAALLAAVLELGLLLAIIRREPRLEPTVRE